MSLLLLDNFDIFAHKVCADFDSCSVVNVAKEYSSFYNLNLLDLTQI